MGGSKKTAKNPYAEILNRQIFKVWIYFLYVGNEFVRLNHAERIFGEKHLVQSQLELLSIAKSFASYKKLRGWELKLKVDLKSKIGEALSSIEKLDGMLPKSNYKEEDYADEKSGKEKKSSKDKGRTIEEEMEDLQKKLRELQRGM